MTKPVVILWIGVVAGAALAALDVATPSWLGRATSSGPSSSRIPEDAVAVVNGRPLSRASYDRALAAIASAKKNGLVEDWEKRRILDRLIEEELLVDAAFSLEAVTRDPWVRTVLSRAVLDHIRSIEAASEPTMSELERFYRENQARLLSAPRVQVEQAFFPVNRADQELEMKTRAEAARAAFLRDPREALGDFGQSPVLRLPDALISADRLQNYLGPTVARVVLSLEVGEVSPPTRSEAGYHVLRLVAFEPGRTPRFEEIRAHVKDLYLRDRDERLVRAFLAERRRASTIAQREVPP